MYCTYFFIYYIINILIRYTMLFLYIIIIFFIYYLHQNWKLCHDFCLPNQRMHLVIYYHLNQALQSERSHFLFYHQCVRYNLQKVNVVVGYSLKGHRTSHRALQHRLVAFWTCPCEMHQLCLPRSQWHRCTMK